MFAYCGNNPIIYLDSLGKASSVCLSEFTNPFTPPTSEPGGGGGLPPHRYTTGCDYGAAADKLLMVWLCKYMSNSDEQVVMDAKYIAFYNGTPVIKVPGASSFSFGIIFMGNKGSLNLFRHEYGHILQLHSLGLLDYGTYVMLPSVLCFWGTEFGLLEENHYYSYPWEYQADQYGGAYHTYEPWAAANSEYYWSQIYK